MLINKRADVCFPRIGSLFAVLLPDLVHIGPIQEIDTNGLIFEFISDGMNAYPKHLEIEIFSLSGHYYLRRIPCKIELISNSADGGFITKRCKVAFAGLTHRQKEKIEQLIERYALHPNDMEI